MKMRSGRAVAKRRVYRRVSGAIAEVMERRVLLSYYQLNTIASFNPYPQGDNPGQLTSDAHGNLYGVTTGGGTYGDGTIFELPQRSSTIETLAMFNGSNGANPTPAQMAIDANGDLFGATDGGTFGSIFELPAGSSTITTLATFNGSNGGVPTGVVLDRQGNLFGSSYSTVFELPAGQHTINTLATFNIPSGTLAPDPTPIVLDSNDDVFGMTVYGGDSESDGSVFEVAHGSGVITYLRQFNGSDGVLPSPAGPSIDSSGNVFGSTQGGGTYDDGILFEITAGAHQFVTLANFNSEGNPPDVGANSNLAIDAQGDLFGTTRSLILGGPGTRNNGTVFELQRGSSSISVFGYFDDVTNGQDPSGVILDSSGDLFGTTQGQGSVFEVAYNSYRIQQIATFASAVDQPSGLAMDAQGDLFGAAGNGGSAGGGMFEISAGSNVIMSFSNGTGDGIGVSLDASGDAFGVLPRGGDSSLNEGSGGGSIFELPSGASTITTLAIFNGSNGSQPTGPLTIDAQNNIYGSTYTGGDLTQNSNQGYGAVYEVASGTNVITPLATFNSTDYGPEGGVGVDASGDVFGATAGGGVNGDGVVYEIVHGSGQVTVLASFNSSFGAYRGGVIADSAGDVFGTIYEGGANYQGSIYEIPKATGVMTVLANFNGSNGYDPIAQMTMDANGNLFGTTSEGGTYNDGTVFELPKGSHMITALVSFNLSNGSYPDSPVILGSNGTIYGVTEMGGVNGQGTVFELVPMTAHPTAVITGAAPISEGGTLSLNGANSSEPGGQITQYSWDLDYDGTTFHASASGVSVTFSAANLIGPTSRVVALQVTDSSGETAITQVTIQVAPVAPTANFIGSSIINGSAGTVTFTNAYNPSAAETAAGFTYSYSFADNGVFSLPTNSPTAIVPASYLTTLGSHTVQGMISDAGGLSTLYTTTVLVNAPAAQLTGTIIGTSGSYQNDGNTIAKAFDGNLSTFFDAPTASGSWAGLDLGLPKIITQVSYASRSGWSSRMNGGSFQGSNSAGFTGGVANLFVIGANANVSSTSLTSSAVNVSTPYRYVRYVGPANSFCDVSELEFFGILPAPVSVSAIGFNSNTSTPSVTITFSGALSGDPGIAAITLTNITNSASTTVPASDLSESCNTSAGIMALSFPGFTNGVLPSGVYQLTLNAADVTDTNGLHPSANASFSFLTVPNGTLSLSMGRGTLSVQQVSIATGASLDMAGSNLILTSGGPAGYSVLQLLVQSGFQSGSWQGSAGIVSSAAAASSRHLTGLGLVISSGQTFESQPTQNGDVLLKYTYYGDANLDGKVDGSDYSLIDNGFASHLTGWANGDFNYDGIINGSDYALIDNAFNSQGVLLAAPPASTVPVARPMMAAAPMEGLDPLFDVSNDKRKGTRNLFSELALN